ncbi:hypothetical protein FKR81_26075 [Lentzea tibetensis]|uniref:Peptidase inhibitor family I36 n=1 Tax=Lentzea tibetensis TaxID=2591470 RepID=A0A563EPC8_9PSEU|nr:peptidase inhibitor family I36 protein [Lentzea tibetensis]TWP49136.1 hypothetical protein FKR81_26075 [Lentzea tibetensis]
MIKKTMAAAAAAFAVAALITPGSASAAPCPNARLCLYAGANLNGTKVAYGTATRCYALPHSSQPNGARSIHNTTSVPWEIYNANGRLLIPAINPGQRVTGIAASTARAMRELCYYPN